MLVKFACYCIQDTVVTPGSHRHRAVGGPAINPENPQTAGSSTDSALSGSGVQAGTIAAR